MYKEALTEIDAIVLLKENGARLVISEEMTETECKEFIKKAIPVLEATDYFSAPTNTVLKEFGWDREKLKAKVVVVEEPQPVESEEFSLKEFIRDAEKIKELKDICQSEPEFKALRGSLSSFKDIEELRTKMGLILEHGMEVLEEVKEEPSDLMLVGKILTRPPFSTLFEISRTTQDAISESMKKNGFDHAHPIILWKDVVVDGHTRLKAAILNGIERVPVEVKLFASEQDALEYAIHNQRDRRNISEAELLSVISVIDAPMSKIDAGAKGGKAEGDKVEPTHKVTAKKLKIGESKVTDARTVLTDADAVLEVQTGKKTIREAARNVREKKKKPRQKSVSALSQVESIVQVLKENAGTEVGMGTIIETAFALFTSHGGQTQLTIMEVTLGTVLEVLTAAGFVRLVSPDMITIKKALK